MLALGTRSGCLLRLRPRTPSTRPLLPLSKWRPCTTQCVMSPASSIYFGDWVSSLHHHRKGRSEDGLSAGNRKRPKPLERSLGFFPRATKRGTRTRRGPDKGNGQKRPPLRVNVSPAPDRPRVVSLRSTSSDERLPMFVRYRTNPQ